ncbi:FAD-binding protein [Geodermatophilus sabuli]|uniref:FAD-binding protein n=1 Tax=Geodermatophilus sabuli TaxID=1564158 RepID=A0A7K3W198_9ACTN|nr:FAD-binding protein [Geodermatophilus sabuli]
MPPTPDCDLLVVGFGAAGAAASLTAARAGASVVVLEKQPADRHTPSTRMSGGLVMGVTDVPAATEYLDRCAGGMVPRDVSARWAERAGGLFDWLAARGLPMTAIGGAEHPELPGAEGIVVGQPGEARYRLDARGGAGTDLYAALTTAVAGTGVQLRWSSPAARLLRDDAGMVTGVRVGDDDGTVVRSRSGVVLACGGYEFDEALKLDHLRAAPVYFYGNPGNTGDGVRMAQALGADLWHMNQMVGRAIGSFPMPDGSRLNLIIGIDPPGYVITDGAGRRFADESQQARLLHGFYYELLGIDPATGGHPRVPCYWFFDDRRRAAGPLTFPHLGAGAVGLYTWSPDNRAEIERGWVHQGATVADAARAAGVADPEAAAATVAAYNAGCATGSDPLGRPAETLVPLDTPPYYCVPLYPGGSNTTGGPRRDARAQVLDVFGDVIPGLYAAGELGQASGLLYPADGSNLSEALCFGQIAAECALAG